MELIVVDTEFTAWEGSLARLWSEPWEHREIVQIGALRTRVGPAPAGDEGAVPAPGPVRTPIEVLDAFDVLVRPSVNPRLSDYFVELTGITQERVDEHGLAFEAALTRFEAFCGDALIGCWGHDHLVVAENVALNGLSPARVRTFVDLRMLFEGTGVNTARVNSGRIGAVMGSDRTIRAHDAVEDCRSVVEGLSRLPPDALAGLRREAAFHTGRG